MIALDRQEKATEGGVDVDYSAVQYVRDQARTCGVLDCAACRSAPVSGTAPGRRTGGAPCAGARLPGALRGAQAWPRPYRDEPTRILFGPPAGRLRAARRGPAGHLQLRRRQGAARSRRTGRSANAYDPGAEGAEPERQRQAHGAAGADGGGARAGGREGAARAGGKGAAGGGAQAQSRARHPLSGPGGARQGARPGAFGGRRHRGPPPPGAWARWRPNDASSTPRWSSTARTRRGRRRG